MKKNLKKALAAAFAGAIAFTSMGLGSAMTVKADEVIPFKADSSANKVIDGSFVIGDATEVSFTLSGVESGKATLGLADKDWSYQDWESSTDIAGDGTYTITAKTAEEADAEISENGTVVFVVDIPVTPDEKFDINDTDYLVSGVTVNGEAVNFIYGDLEEKGNIRIEIYNEYGQTNTNANVWDGFVADASAEETSSADVDLDGKYGAYLSIQGPKYTFRDSWDSETTGFGTDFFNQLTFQGDTANGESVPATITDSDIAGNGTYTVSITDIQFPEDEFEAQDFLNLIVLSTSIPNTGAVSISDVKLSVNGNSVSDITPTQEEGCDYIKLNIQNIWSDIDTVKAIGYYSVPVTSVEVTFTVSGFNYDAEVTAPAEDAAEDTLEVTSEEPAKESSPVLPIVIVIIIVVVIAAVVCVVLKKKKNN